MEHKAVTPLFQTCESAGSLTDIVSEVNPFRRLRWRSKISEPFRKNIVLKSTPQLRQISIYTSPWNGTP